ncbi:MAG: polysaccharide biosynthesis C-terminal domain-containing protein [Deltaproteobacteria bacterium]|nr:polysaccharide biosynthesis C-terminal domain-containing protein [Deltaproteobacteria bacterium]
MSKLAAAMNASPAAPAAAAAGPPPAGGPGRLLSTSLVLSVLFLAMQAATLLTQMVIAARFGASAEFDAYLASSTLPQFGLQVVVSSLPIVVLPLFVEHSLASGEDEAWLVTSGAVNLTVAGLAVIAVLGILFAGPLLRLTAPGLAPHQHARAVTLAVYLWPALVLTTLVSLLSAVHQAQGRFAWPGVVPLVGAVVSLAVILGLSHTLGVTAVALALLLSAAGQVAILAALTAPSRRYRFGFHWSHAGVRRLVMLALPLLVANVVMRSTPIVDRYLGSRLAEGSIARLEYAWRIPLLLGLLVSNGIGTVVFTSLSHSAATRDLAGFRATVSTGLRYTMLALAPLVALGIALASPLVTVLLQRGRFGAADAATVATLLQIFMLATVGAALGMIVGRCFYALKAMRLLAIAGVIEALAYAAYAPLFVRWLGVSGIAWATVLYFDFSITWALLLLRHRTGASGRGVARAALQCSAAALVAGATAWWIARLSLRPLATLALGAGAGFVVYAGALALLRSPELRAAWLALTAWWRGRDLARGDTPGVPPGPGAAS